MQDQLEYYPAVFDAPTIEAAKAIILTPECGLTTEERWVTETPYLADLIEQKFDLSPSSVVLDFGCGIGRMARELISRTGCRVIGCDISPNQRGLAPTYVQSDRFFACPPEMLVWLLDRGERFDAALAIWVLQHCTRPEMDVGLLRRALRPGGKLFVVNEKHRCIPVLQDGTTKGWATDRADVQEMLVRAFTKGESYALDEAVVTKEHGERAFWGVFEKKS